MPYKDIEKRRESNLRSYFKHREKRLEYARQFYIEHREQKNQSSRQRKARLKQKGLCVDCVKEKATPGYILCAWCSYKNNIRGSHYRQSHRNILILKDRERRRKHLLEGRCRCGAPLIEDEVKYCFACRASGCRPR